VPAPSSVNALVPAALDRIVLTALQPVPARRHGSAAAMAEAFDELDRSPRARSERLAAGRAAGDRSRAPAHRAPPPPSSRPRAREITTVAWDGGVGAELVEPS
jgi:hypothetical protein